MICSSRNRARRLARSCSDFECCCSHFQERLVLFTLAVWPVSSFQEDGDVVSALGRLRRQVERSLLCCSRQRYAGSNCYPGLMVGTNHAAANRLLLQIERRLLVKTHLRALLYRADVTLTHLREELGTVRASRTFSSTSDRLLVRPCSSVPRLGRRGSQRRPA